MELKAILPPSNPVDGSQKQLIHAGPKVSVRMRVFFFKVVSES